MGDSVASYLRLKQVIGGDRVLFISYRDLTSDKSLTIKKILTFLGWELSDEEREEVVRATSFGEMSRKSPGHVKSGGSSIPDSLSNGFITRVVNAIVERGVFVLEQEAIGRDCCEEISDIDRAWLKLPQYYPAYMVAFLRSRSPFGHRFKQLRKRLLGR